MLLGTQLKKVEEVGNIDTSLIDLKDRLSSFLVTPEVPYQIEEYLLFTEKGNLLGYTYLEGQKDLKNMMATFKVGENVPLETQEEMVNESVGYALNNLDMFDLNFLHGGNIDPFLKAATDHDLDISIDHDMIVFSKDYEMELESKKQY